MRAPRLIAAIFVAAAMDARDTAGTLLDLGRYCEGLDYERTAEHHQAVAWAVNTVATLYQTAHAA